MAESRDREEMATAQIAPIRGESTLQVTIGTDALAELLALSTSTGQSIDRLLSISIGLLRMAVNAHSVGRRLVLTSRSWWPVREIVIPKSS